MAFPSKLLNDGERVVVSTRTHPKALILPGLALLVGLVVGLWLWFRVDNQWVGYLGLLVALVAAAWFLAVPFLRWLTTTYTFTNRRFIKRSGFIAKQGRTIPLNRISGVDFDIDVLDRLFGCGTLVVSDASTDGSVLLHDIPHVEKVQLLVSDELHHLTTGDGRDDGA